MSVIRAFIAIEMPSEIQASLDNVSANLAAELAGIPIRWIPAKNIHLTIKFLGDVSISNIELLKEILSAEADLHTAFEISVGDLGAFPSQSRPRVLWVAVQAPPALLSIRSGLEKETARIGYAREKRPFSPHLTLGRVSRNANSREVRKVWEVLSSHTVGFLGAARVQDLHLFRSDLKPGGAVYTKLFSAHLKPED